MISDPKSILYASVSKGTLVLSDYSTGDPDLEILALQCLGQAPAFHTVFTHIVNRRIYIFLMEDSFVYFAIFEEEVGKSQGLRFLDRVKIAFLKILKSKSIDNSVSLTAHCFHNELSPIFQSLIAPPEEPKAVDPPEIIFRDGPNVSLDSGNAKKVASIPLLGKESKNSKKKKKSWNISGKDRNLSLENIENFSEDANLSREFPSSSQKNGSFAATGGRHKAQRMWRQRVWVVLTLDLFVCCVLFGVWLWICRGFKCIEG